MINNTQKLSSDSDELDPELSKDCIPMEDFLDNLQEKLDREKKDPKIIKFFREISYYIRYRIPEWPYNIKMHIIRFYQRGRYGWSKYDVYSLDDYTDKVMIGALNNLKKKKMGYPCIIEQDFPNYPIDEEAKFDYFIAQWNNILDQMIAGFEANQRISDSLYEKELGPYPVFIYRNATPEQIAARDERAKKSKELEERDLELLNKGLALFSKYYRQLWW